MKSLPEKVRETGRFPLGRFRGLNFGLVAPSQGGREVFLEGATTRETQLSRESQGPRAVMNALDRLAGSYESQAKAAAQELAIAQAQLRDHQARLGIPFPHDAYFTELARLRDELKAALSEAQAEPGRGPVPPPAEPAGRIEALRAAHAIEPLPERTPKRRGQAAESPVTTRIRERTGISSPEPMTDFLEFPAGPTPFPEGTRVNRFQEFKLTMFSFPRSLPLLETVRKLVARSSPPPTH